MTSYRVEVDGETVWTGEGDDYKVIPAEYRDRPADTDPPHYLYESVEDDNGEHGAADQLFAIQVSLAHEADLENEDHPKENG